MIHIQNDLYLDADKYQFILIRKMKAGPKAKKPGSTTFKHIAYWPTLRHVVVGLTEMKLYDMVQKIRDLQDIQDGLAAWADSLKSPLLAELKAAVAAYTITEQQHEETTD